jgi:serine/threonine-protein kinase
MPRSVAPRAHVSIHGNFPAIGDGIAMSTAGDESLPRAEVAIDPTLPQPGDLVAGKFRIERLLGRGSMGAVFVAEHELLRRRVALKLMISDIAAHPEAVPRFLSEARAAARLQDEHVAQVIDAGTLEHGVPYMVLEYLEGADLARLLAARGAFPATEAVGYLLQALDGLARAHALGIVHRDLKPSNLFLTRRADGSPVVKVLDFGISKVDASTDMSNPDITGARAALGTPPYASPEQLCDSRGVDARADVWSAGVVLYELVTGALPFPGGAAAQQVAATLEPSPSPLRGKLTDVDPGLEAIVMRCLSRDRWQRFANVEELARALEPYGPPAAHEPRDVPRPRTRPWPPAGAVVAGALVLAAAVAFSVHAVRHRSDAGAPVTFARVPVEAAPLSARVESPRPRPSDDAAPSLSQPSPVSPLSAPSPLLPSAPPTPARTARPSPPAAPALR